MLCSKIQHCLDCHFNFQNINYFYSKYVVTIKMDSKRKPQCMMEQPDSQTMKMLLGDSRRDWQTVNYNIRYIFLSVLSPVARPLTLIVNIQLCF